ncbi:MAG: hypothetical protein K0B37_12425, partial [Bacteroidales bacterium]|nr:hypothetical protein [Bacteroidales bacterium]
MKKNILLVFVALVAFTMSCEKDALENFSQNDQIDLKSQPIPGNYDITFSYVGETTLTFVIDQSGAQSVSHMLFQFIDCYGEYLTIDNVISATVNEIDWEDKIVSGSGFDYECTDDSNFDLNSPFIKLDDFEFDGVDIVTVVIVLDQKVANVDYLIKSGNNCFVYDEQTNICDFTEECFEWVGETAWSDGERYVEQGNWATYTEYEADLTVTLFAGQTFEAGTVHFSAVVDDEVTITITLEGDWIFAEYEMGEAVEENVKIQDYEFSPSGNPAPGQFAHKATVAGQSY